MYELFFESPSRIMKSKEGMDVWKENFKEEEKQHLQVKSMVALEIISLHLKEQQEGRCLTCNS